VAEDVQRLALDHIELTLLNANNQLPVNHFGSYINDIYIDGIDFPANPPVLWRETNASGMVIPNQPWSWTLQSSNGGVTLNQSSVARWPSTENVNGLPVTVQRIDTTMTFSGNASGTLTVTHVQKVGDNLKMREQYVGDITVFGEHDNINTTIVLGGLGGISG
jgi:hypothetical protein